MSQRVWRGLQTCPCKLQKVLVEFCGVHHHVSNMVRTGDAKGVSEQMASAMRRGRGTREGAGERGAELEARGKSRMGTETEEEIKGGDSRWGKWSSSRGGLDGMRVGGKDQGTGEKGGEGEAEMGDLCNSMNKTW